MITYTLVERGNAVYEPMSYVLPQKHIDCEIIYYRSAVGVTTIDKEIYTIQADSFAIIPPNMEHDELVQRPGQVLFCRFIGSDGSSPFQNSMFFQKCAGSETIYAILTKIVDEDIGQRHRYQEYVDLLFKQLILEIERLSAKKKHPDVVACVEEYIQNSYSEPIDFERLSESYGYSLSRLRHIFKEVKKVSLYQYLINIRMAAAKRYLKSTALSIQQVASFCGYGEANFITMFNQRFGITPMQYRMQLLSTDGKTLVFKDGDMEMLTSENT